MPRKKKPATPATPAAPVEATARQRRQPRRTNFTPALGRAICKMVGAGATLVTVCKRPRMPHERTVRGWLLNPANPQQTAFAAMYFRAHEIAVARLADEILDIADDASNDYMTHEWANGALHRTLNSEHVNRSRLRIDARKWLLSKLLPETFGDRPVAAKEQTPATVHTPAKPAAGDESRDHLAPSINRFTGKLEEKKKAKAAAAAQASPTPAPTTDDTEDAPDEGTSANVRKLH